MFRVPTYFIFVFVGLSALSAYFFSKLPSNSSREKTGMVTRELASEEQLELPSPVFKNLSPFFKFEDSQSCGDERNYLEKELAKIPSLYRDERARRPAEFPRECMTYILRKFLPGTETKSDSFFTRCDRRDTSPQRGAVKPCITANYVNAIYNYFGDFTTCFAVPQRDFLPILFNVSGLHLNALGADFAAGPGQLVGPMIERANRRFSEFKAEMLSSSKEACQNLVSSVRNLEPARVDLTQRCQLVLPPENPMLNIFYLVIKYKQDREEIEKSLKDTVLKITLRLSELGLGEKDYDPEQLIQMMTILAFRMGAQGAVLSLKEYLDLTVSQNRKLTLTDFDFGKENKIEDKGNLTFSAFLMSKQKTDSVGFLNSVKRAADELNEVLKGGTCVPDSYLAL